MKREITIETDVIAELKNELIERALKSVLFDSAFEKIVREASCEDEIKTRLEGLMYGLELVDVPKNSRYCGKLKINY